jgi:hypothetical protein
MDKLPDISNECTCNGNCSVCVNAVGRSQAVYLECPDCPIHGKTDVAKSHRTEILKNLENFNG